LSYLPDPVHSIGELLRVTKPGKRMVITSVKPKPDFSKMYRGVAEKCQTQQELESSRKLLDNAAGLAERESIGKFRFFSDDELKSLVQHFKITGSSIERSFGNQANVLMIEK
jgi:ubiquinone/menaquinone biosynthesis C-methylase UbiE